MENKASLAFFHSERGCGNPVTSAIITGIKHCFSCIRVCKAPREMLKTEGRNPRFLTRPPEGPEEH